MSFIVFLWMSLKENTGIITVVDRYSKTTQSIPYGLGLDVNHEAFLFSALFWRKSRFLKSIAEDSNLIIVGHF